MFTLSKSEFSRRPKPSLGHLHGLRTLWRRQVAEKGMQCPPSRSRLANEKMAAENARSPSPFLTASSYGLGGRIWVGGKWGGKYFIVDRAVRAEGGKGGSERVLVLLVAG
ncbi:hypothetical protein ZHAS_00021851 [Anopheles sinensis]|uniref:Uncharacterized protein n=1 Tax=Anopheles sinensis TaxID=74873 RepID=A0A084WTR7_ANOSI|nr:hypothetical protein ZHAS_00021851 [Anopheles sinensis]